MDARREDLKEYTRLAGIGEKMRKEAVSKLSSLSESFLMKTGYDRKAKVIGQKVYTCGVSAGGEAYLRISYSTPNGYGNTIADRNFTAWAKRLSELPHDIQNLVMDYMAETREAHAVKDEALKARLDARHKRDDLREILTVADKETCVKLGYSISNYGKDYFGVDLPDNIHVVFEHGQIARIRWNYDWFTLKQMLKCFQSHGWDENYNNLKTFAENFQS